MNQANTQQKTGEGRPGYSQKSQGNHNVSLSQAQQDFINAMHAAGIAPHDSGVIVADGTLHRFRVQNDKQGTKNGYYVLHLDGLPAGFFGSWRHGISQPWCSIDKGRLTHAQREENRRRMEAARRAAAAEQEQRHRDAADKAAYLWSSAKPAPADFHYLERKLIAPGVARIRGDVLVLPIVDVDNRLHSLQFITEDGQKRFLTGGKKKGCFIAVQAPENPTRTLIAEGWATAQTLAEIEPQSCIIAALDAGNLESVALAIRTKYPDADIVIACDNDRATPGNPGVNKGRAAAIQAGAKILIPNFPADAPPELSDFNDLMLWRAKV